jgi:predicted RNase H-like HicB family nuclease
METPGIEVFMGSSIATFLERHLLRAVAHLRNAYVVFATWDHDAGVWYVRESSVPGLSLEAESVEELVRKLEVAVPELVALNARKTDRRDDRGHTVFRVTFEDCAQSA